MQMPVRNGLRDSLIGADSQTDRPVQEGNAYAGTDRHPASTPTAPPKPTSSKTPQTGSYPQKTGKCYVTVASVTLHRANAAFGKQAESPFRRFVA